MAESTALEALTAELLGDVGRLHDDVKDLASALPDAAQVIRQAGESGAEELRKAVSQAVSEVAKGTAEAEAAKLQVAFKKVAENVLQDIRQQAHAAAPSAWKIKVAISISFLAFIFSMAGAIIGYWYATTKQAPGAEISRQVAAGKDFLKILPLLDQPTRDKLVKLIEQNKQ